MDASVRKEISSLLEELTHSGSATLDPNLIKRLKSICRSSDMYVRAVYEITMGHLSKDHAEVRLSSFQVIKELFSRSHVFRELVISEFQKFSALVTGTDAQSPLPPPQQAAVQLKEKSLLAIREWNDKYGTGYPKLKLGYNYLKINKKVNFDELVAQTEVARRRQEERAGRQRAVLQQKIQEVKQEMKDLTRDIEECITQISSCFNLLMPRFDLPDIYSTPHIPEGGRCSGDEPPQAMTVLRVPQLTSEISVEQKKLVTKRRLSSSSFYSLSEHSDCVDDTMDSLDIKTLPIQQESKEISASSIGNTQHIHVDSEPEDSDSEFLRRHYGISTGETPGGMKNCKSGSKGKAPLKTTPNELFAGSEVNDNELREVPDSCTNEQSESGSDSDSEFEWEDVDPAFDFDLQAHGIATHGFSIPIQFDAIPVLREDKNNSSILTALKENKHLLADKHLLTINKWMEWLSKGGGEDTSLREAIDLKHKVQVTLDKFERISIIFKEPPLKKKEDTEPETANVRDDEAQITNPEWEIQPPSSISTFDLELDPTTPQAQIAKLRMNLSVQAKDQLNPAPKTVLSNKNSLLSKAPVVPFGMDLYHWETPTHQLQPLTKAPMGSLHRFWVQERDVDVSSDEQARLRCRTITYPGTFEPVEITCRSRLSNGKLCPRMDRIKCPFHGTIIPRDEQGDPVLKSQSQSRAVVMPLDPSLREAIRDAQGTELLQGRKEKKKGGKQKVKKHPGLTDLKVQRDTPRTRLEKKILSKRALKRVAESVDTANAKKYMDKFGYNFNYALGK